jgi:NADPH-dependent 2,4-dienoyl-CoA reductase/sulfur reductase-like enzyme
MSFWDTMPRGMLLRSAWDACHIAFPDGDLTLDSYKAQTHRNFTKPVPLDEFIRYGHWFQQNAVPHLDHRRVASINVDAGGFTLLLADGETVDATRVVVAAGIDAFAAWPPIFDDFSPDLVSHASDHRDLGRFAADRVVVLGGGQSALESAALLHEAGADVEVIARTGAITWLRGGSTQRTLGRYKPLFYAQTDVGPLGLSRLVAAPRLFGRLPRPLQDRLAYRAIRPAGARWLVGRLESVPITTGRHVAHAGVSGGRMHLVLDDGTLRVADHVILGTGYRVDVADYDFLAPPVMGGLLRAGGYPILGSGLESSIPGLHFLGAPAAWSFGPIMRFVSGSWYAANALAEQVRRTRET